VCCHARGGDCGRGGPSLGRSRPEDELAATAQAGLHTSKKAFGYAERDEALREPCRQEVAEMPPEQRVYRDETGLENHEARAYGWSPQGEPRWGEKPGPRTPRVSRLAALPPPQLIAPLVCEGTCNTALFEAYGERCLVPLLKPGQVVIYDNARFHQSAKARRLIAGAGGTQKCSPSYSPDLNPFAHYWFPLKQRVRKLLPACNRDLHKTFAAVLSQPQTP
jgi:transposase